MCFWRWSWHLVPCGGMLLLLAALGAVAFGPKPTVATFGQDAMRLAVPVRAESAGYVVPSPFERTDSLLAAIEEKVKARR